MYLQAKSGQADVGGGRKADLASCVHPALKPTLPQRRIGAVVHWLLVQPLCSRPKSPTRKVFCKSPSMPRCHVAAACPTEQTSRLPFLFSLFVCASSLPLSSSTSPSSPFFSLPL